MFETISDKILRVYPFHPGDATNFLTKYFEFLPPSLRGKRERERERKNLQGQQEERKRAVISPSVSLALQLHSCSVELESLGQSHRMAGLSLGIKRGSLVSVPDQVQLRQSLRPDRRGGPLMNRLSSV